MAKPSPPIFSCMQIKDISLKIGPVQVLKNVSFRIPEGSISAIVGPNGAGKSTLLKVISGFLQPDTGEVILDGVSNPGFYERLKLISYLPETVEMYPELRVREFVEFVENSTRVKSSHLISWLGIEDVWDKRISHLSKGYKQRLKLYFALHRRTKYALLDEPFDGFDPLQIRKISELIRKMQDEGRNFLLTIHNLSYAEKICDYIIILRGGEVVTSGYVDELKEKFGSPDLEGVFIKAIA